MTDDADVDALAAEIRSGSSTVALTGAGVSTASGIPSFRGAEGIWETEFDPADFRISRFERDPSGFWEDRLRLYEAMYPENVEPNAAHEALARLEDAGHLSGVVTQNTDGLHAAAGSDEVVELHGTNARVRCRWCDRTEDAERARERASEGELPPRCPECDGALKPDVVLFGEALPREAFARARELVAGSDVLIVAGSSLTVDPAASLPREANGTLAIVNFDETRHDVRADYLFRADVTELLPELAARATDSGR